MDSLSQESFLIGDWYVSPAEGLLKRGDNVAHLEPKAMELLVYLAKHQGEVVTREEIENDVWHGALASYDSITSTVIKLRKALQDSARKPDYIATIPKRGYQLIAMVQEPASENPYSDPTSSAGSEQQQHSTKRKWNYLLAGILIVAVILIWLELSTDNKAVVSDKPEAAPVSIAVLPFENLSVDKRQEYLADGITEDITTDLSHIANLLVISSTASSQYKNTQVNPKDIGKELNVGFILRGSVRKQNGMVRVNAQLIDTTTGFNKWGQTYDREVADIFAIQSEVTNSIIGVFGFELSGLENDRLAHKMTNNLAAYDSFQEGQRHSRELTRESNELAQKAYLNAIKTDVEYGRAYGALAYSLAQAYHRGWTDAPRETLDRALRLAMDGVKLDSNIPQTHWALGYVYLMREELEDAARAAAESVVVAPSYADGYGLLALINNNIGNPEKAIEYVTRGMRLNPYYTWDYLYNLGRAYYSLGRYEEAIKTLEQARERNENAVNIRLFLAASYVGAGRKDDAEWEAEQISMLHPTETVSHNRQSMPISNAELKEKILDDLRKAGLPE